MSGVYHLLIYIYLLMCVPVRVSRVSCMQRTTYVMTELSFELSSFVHSRVLCYANNIQRGYILLKFVDTFHGN